MQTAWRERNPVARIKAAHEALEKNPECAPAFILLAEEEATTILESEKILKQALQVAEKNHRKTQQLQHQSALMEASHSKITKVTEYQWLIILISQEETLTY
jgi:ST7 protein